MRALLIDSNVLFVRRVTDALKAAGFEVLHHPEAAYALTMLEWNAPDIILCATELRGMGAFDIVPLLRNEPKTAKIPLMALGNGSNPGQFSAFRAGCDDYIDRRGNPADIARQVRSFLMSSQQGFRPTQLISSNDTSLSGNLAHMDLPGIVQMLSQATQTGALHINAGETDAVLFFDAGEMCHAEYGKLTGEDAVLQVVKDCHQAAAGVYNFVVGSLTAERTVHRRATDLLMDAFRQYDEAQREVAEKETP